MSAPAVAVQEGGELLQVEALLGRALRTVENGGELASAMADSADAVRLMALVLTAQGVHRGFEG